MSVLSDRDGFVTFRGGLSVPIPAWMLAIDLELRGISLTPCPDGDILVRPFSKLTEEDKRQIRYWKRDVIAVLSYQAPVPDWVQ